MKRLLLCALLLGCPKPKEDLGNVGVSKASDKCTVLAHRCPGSADDDGCPDVMIEVGDSCQITAKGVENLQQAADEMLNDKDLTRLIIIAPTMTCANIVRAHFEQRNVPSWRLVVAEQANRTFISFEVAAFKEKSCRDGAPVKPPGGSVY
jgi:hypothetical protein